jgi:hypothetical protein
MAWINIGVRIIFVKDKDWNRKCRGLSITCYSAAQDVFSIKNWRDELSLHWAQSVPPLQDDFLDDRIESGESNRVLPAGFKAHGNAKA